MSVFTKPIKYTRDDDTLYHIKQLESRIESLEERIKKLELEAW
ncbi:MAG: hypothetical protein WA667_23750 [Candidatus Nitrosopolaris sp.]